MHYQFTLASGETVKLTLIQNKILHLIYEEMDFVGDEDEWTQYFQKHYACPPRGIRMRKFLFDHEEGWAYTDCGKAHITPNESDLDAVIEQAINRVKETKYAKYKFLKNLKPHRARVLLEFAADIF